MSRFFRDMSDSIVNLFQYKRFAEEPWGKVLSYLMLMVFILGLPVLLTIVFDVNRSLDDLTDKFNRHVPDFVIEDGELTVFGEVPLVIETINERDKIAFIIDTSEKADIKALDEYDAGIFISKNEAVVRQNALKDQTYSFSTLKGESIDKADLEVFFSYVKYTGIFVVLIGLLYFFISKLCTAAILGLLCLFLSMMQNAGLRYGQTFKIAVYALTLPTLFQALHQILAPQFYYGWSIYYSMAFLYLWFAVRAIGIDKDNQ